MSKYYNWMLDNLGEHTNGIGEVNMTTLAEDCADHFGVITAFGDSDEEERIFETAAEFGPTH